MPHSCENAQYTHPRLIPLYDLQNSGVADYQFYEHRLGPAPLSVVDIGCGTGVFAVRLAALGHHVVAIDPAPAMLAAARARPGAEAVRWLEGGAAQLPDDEHYNVAVMTGHAFQCLLSDAEVQSTLRAVRQRLQPGGRLMFESRNPQARPWLKWTAEQSRHVLATPDGEQVEIHHQTQELAGELLRFATHYHFLPGGERLRSDSVLRFMPQARIAGHLARAGFSRVDWHGDWQGEPWRADSAEIIVIAQADLE